MCGLAGIAGTGWHPEQLRAMVAAQRHRGPDDEGVYLSDDGHVGLGHNRLSIIDLSPAGHQPMSNHDGTIWIVFNGEIYNYKELRAELHDYPYSSETDTEVILAAYERWGEACLDRFIGMFSFILWDERKKWLFAARDRFGVKPLYYATLPRDGLALASEIKALHAFGLPREPDPVTWSTYLSYGLYDYSERTFWQGIQSLPAGHALRWQPGAPVRLWQWYDLAERLQDTPDTRPDHEVREAYRELLMRSVTLRFRSDVPVGINLSGGLDSSTLLGLVQYLLGPASELQVFTFVTGDPEYDELPWVRQMLQKTSHSLTTCRLDPEDVPQLAEAVQRHQDEPFGGLPTLAYARVFEEARRAGVIVLLDGQGMDEQWAGYDYYRRALNGGLLSAASFTTGPVQGSRSRSLRPECLTPEFRMLAERWRPQSLFSEPLLNLQYRDACAAKIPRALRFNDRISMMHSTELREPFLDHRLFELALRQPAARKIRNGTHKWLLRQIAAALLPGGVVEAPKRPVQTPQREWLRGPLRDWCRQCIEEALMAFGGSWLESRTVRKQWAQYCEGRSDNSFYIWQWISLALWARCGARNESKAVEPEESYV